MFYKSLKKMINIIQKFLLMKLCVCNIYKMNKTKELKIDSTLWATPSKLVNLLDFNPDKISIKTENHANDIKVLT